MSRDPVHHSDLSKNILSFSQALRKKKVGATVDNVLDVLRGLESIDLRRKEDFYLLLRSNLVSRKEEMPIFDEIFERFWSRAEEKRPALREEEDDASMARADEDQPLSTRSKEEKLTHLEDLAEEGEEEGPPEESEVAAYSPREALSRKDFQHLNADELDRMKEVVSDLARKLALTLSRRWRRGKTGDLLDFRRSLRHSLKYGGEILELRMRERKVKPLRLVLLCDVSGSMDVYSGFFLLFMMGLQNHYPFCNTFVFSTRLTPVTYLLKRRSFRETLDLLSQKVLDWSGGTNTGAALHQLHQDHSMLLNPRRTLFLIFSDGWDRGDMAVLDQEMKNVKRRVKRILWLNPLKGSPRYQPLCEGMATAFPYLDHFLPCHNLASLRHLSRIMANT